MSNVSNVSKSKAALLVLAVTALGGCSGGAPARNQQVGATGGASGTGDLPAARGPGGTGDVSVGNGGTASPTGLGGSPVAGAGAPCSTLLLSAPLTLPPAAPGQLYTRCGTLGPEADWTARLSPSATRLAALTGAGIVRLIATDNWTDVAQLASPVARMTATAFSPDGAKLATVASEMGQVALWSAIDGALLSTFVGPPTSGVDTTGGALAFSSDGRRLATPLGTVIDLQTGASTSWFAGIPSSSPLRPNAANLDLTSPTGGTIASLRFTAGDARLLVETTYRIGNSPPSTRLELRAPGTGQPVSTMFDMYTRALLGFALSPDGRHVALGKSGEASAGGFAPGLSVFDTTTGAEVAFDSAFTGTVLGFSPDGARLYTRIGGSIHVVASGDLSPIVQFDWPAEAVFLAISPAGDLVGSLAGATSWWDPTTGAVVRTEDAPLTAVTWSADGRFGAGTGDPARLFHFWREADAAQLCAPPADTSSAPPLASLGTPGPAERQSVTSDDGSLTVTAAFVFHTHAVNYDALAVTDTASGTLLRQFGAAIDGSSAIARPSGDRLYTRAGPDVAVWCR